MWLVDERYWLMFSNRTLQTSIGDALSAEDKRRHGKKRPDFVCVTVGTKLIILELKRPSYVLTVDDLNQLETYITVAERYSTFKSYETYLVGSSIDDELQRRMKHRAAAFKLLTYSDLIEGTKQRYAEYLRSVQ